MKGEKKVKTTKTGRAFPDAVKAPARRAEGFVKAAILRVIWVSEKIETTVRSSVSDVVIRHKKRWVLLSPIANNHCPDIKEAERFLLTFPYTNPLVYIRSGGSGYYSQTQRPFPCTLFFPPYNKAGFRETFREKCVTALTGCHPYSLSKRCLEIISVFIKKADLVWLLHQQGAFRWPAVLQRCCSLLWKHTSFRSADNSSQQVPTYLFSLSFSNASVCISASIVCAFFPPPGFFSALCLSFLCLLLTFSSHFLSLKLPAMWFKNGASQYLCCKSRLTLDSGRFFSLKVLAGISLNKPAPSAWQGAEGDAHVSPFPSSCPYSTCTYSWLSDHFIRSACFDFTAAAGLSQPASSHSAVERAKFVKRLERGLFDAEIGASCKAQR